MIIICPVCKTKYKENASTCSICGFSDELGINRTFPIPEDLTYWLNTVVKPYRVKWKAKKRGVTPLVQINTSKKHENDERRRIEIEANRKAEEESNQRFKKLLIGILVGMVTVSICIIVIIFGTLNGWFNKENNSKDIERVVERSFETNPVANDVFMEMVKIPAGTFKRGNTIITLNSFKMAQYEVTQEQYQTVMGMNPSSFNSNPATGEVQSKRPVENIKWFEAIEFCIKLSEMEKLTPVYTITNRRPANGYPISSATLTVNWSANGYRLPTEAQWEYACRAGSITNWHFGNNESELVNYAWYGDEFDMTHQVGLKAPNAWGLYDMHGNVWEWCWDWYNEEYPNVSQDNPIGHDFGTYRVFRGGGYGSPSENLFSEKRGWGELTHLSYGLGFRVVLP